MCASQCRVDHHPPPFRGTTARTHSWMGFPVHTHTHTPRPSLSHRHDGTPQALAGHWQPEARNPVPHRWMGWTARHPAPAAPSSSTETQRQHTPQHTATAALNNTSHTGSRGAGEDTHTQLRTGLAGSRLRVRLRLQAHSGDEVHNRKPNGHHWVQAQRLKRFKIHRRRAEKVRGREENKNLGANTSGCVGLYWQQSIVPNP